MDGALAMTLPRKTIFVVDDDAAVRASMIKVLKGAGYEVMTASDGQEASARFAPERIDLVLLDLNLPFRSGWEVFEGLTTRYPTIPIIIITAMPNQYRTALAAGVGALMEKPIEVPALLQTMEALLAESPEARLRRMCGYQRDTKLFRASHVGRVGDLPSSITKLRPRQRTQPSHRS